MSRIHRRRFLQTTSAAIGGAALLARPVHARGINEKLNIGFIGFGTRAKELMPQFAKLSDVRIAALCDVDEERLHEKAKSFPDAKKYGDLRKLYDDKDIDAVVIMVCNHWHALAAIWACQAGKDVYVEKPLTHNHWEGQQLVNAARKYDRIVQIGTQQRSDPLQHELKEYLHTKKALGEIKYVQVNRLAKRDPIGKRSTPLEIPKTVNYDVWLGPARDQPIYRDKLHYDWHWDWNTGSGELGNWGVHVMDDALNVALLDRCPFPKRIAAGGGRFVWNDAGETPNVSFAYYDTGSVPLMLGVSNLPDGPRNPKGLTFDDMGTGYVVHCEGGYYSGGRGGGKAHDHDGNVIHTFRGDAGVIRHPRNFVEAVFAHDRKHLNAEVQIGHQSTAWCNLANATVRAGRYDTVADALSVRENFKPWGSLVEHFEEHLKHNNVNIKKSKFQLGRLVEFDSEKQHFVGDGAENANRYLRREYRSQFEVPAIA